MHGSLAQANGILLRRDAVAAGMDDNALRRAVCAGHLYRIRQGVYVLSDVWDAASAVHRHRLLADAVRSLYDARAALSHLSANLEWGGPNWGSDLSSVHLTNLERFAERNAARVIHHRGTCLVGDITRDQKGWITTPTRTALDTAALLAQEPAVAVLDWYLNEGLTTREELAIGAESMATWPGTLGLVRRIGLADGSAESVGETRSRLLFKRQGLPTPVPQLEIYRPNGRLAGRVDFAWPERGCMVEFDGMEKYLRLRKPGETLEQAIIREKRREDLLRELTGWRMIRLVWADLDRPEATASRIRRAFAAAA